MEARQLVKIYHFVTDETGPVLVSAEYLVWYNGPVDEESGGLVFWPPYQATLRVLKSIEGTPVDLIDTKTGYPSQYAFLTRGAAIAHEIRAQKAMQRLDAAERIDLQRRQRNIESAMERRRESLAVLEPQLREALAAGEVPSVKDLVPPIE